MKPRILMIGDLHQNFKPIRQLYNYYKESTHPFTKEDTLICLGDFGANFYFDHRDKNFKEKLGKYDIQYFVIRGNHEERPSNCVKKDPNDWHTEIFWGNKVYVENDYPYIKYALDYPAKYEILTKHRTILKTLVLPGAYSIDKYYRLLHKWSWFPQEQCNIQERADGLVLARLNTWDLVLSHTCPAIYEPTDLFLSFIDQTTVDKTTEQWLGQIEWNLDYKLWAFGHFHKTRVYPMVDGKDKVMLFNDFAFDLNKYFNPNIKNIVPYDCLIENYENIINKP